MTISTDHEDARAFLLKQLTSEETERFEERLLAEDELIAETETVEAELLDAFVWDALPPHESAVMAERFRDRPERVVFAKALSIRTRPRPQRAIRWLLPVAASLAIATSAVLLTRRAPEPVPSPAPVPRATLDDHATAKPVAPPVPQPAIPAVRPIRFATVLITLSTTRDAGESPRLLLARDLDVARLRIRINPADRFSAYAVDLTTSDGAIAWSGRATRTGAELVVEIPAGSLRNGEHQVAVNGINADGSREELGYQTLFIDRSFIDRR